MNSLSITQARKALRNELGISRLTRHHIAALVEKRGYRDLSYDGYSSQLDIGAWYTNDVGHRYSVFLTRFYSLNELVLALANRTI